jgi:RND family efflux transporter MFP subunit
MKCHCPRIIRIGILSLTVGLVGCEKKQNAFEPPPPPSVTVETPERKDTTVYMDFPGRTQAFKSVQVRARLPGVLQTRHFDEGQLVKQGDPLFTIEPEPYQAALEAAEGELAKAVAALENATADRSSLEKAANAVSKLDVERSRASEKSAEAAVKVASASVTKAKIDLSHTKIDAPESGRTSRALVDVGNLVGSSEPTLLTTIVNDSIMYANFEVNERIILPFLSKRLDDPTKGLSADGKSQGGELISTFERQKGGGAANAETGDVAVRLRLSDGTEYNGGSDVGAKAAYKGDGIIDFIDNTVDPNTGTIGVRVRFENPNKVLAPGLFVRVLLPESKKNSILVPGSAVQRDMQGDFVFIVDGGNKVERRDVTVAQLVGDKRIIEEGLEGNERVITRGLQRAREGLEVAPVNADGSKSQPQGGAVGPTEADNNGKKLPPAKPGKVEGA